jgi:hypothetical protein
MDLVPFTLHEGMDFWTTGPIFFWMRLGLLLLGMGGLWFAEDRVVGTAGERYMLPGWLTTLGVESLFIYIAHLLFLYGSALNPEFNVTGWLGRDLTPLIASLLVVPFLLIAAVAARWWRHLKKHHEHWMRLAYWWMGLSIAGELVIRAY